jgi:hypothetical protein
MAMICHDFLPKIPVNQADELQDKDKAPHAISQSACIHYPITTIPLKPRTKHQVPN